MSGQNDNKSDDLVIPLVLILIIGVLWFVSVRYEQIGLILWKFIRTIEFILTFNLPSVYGLWTTPMRWGDPNFIFYNKIFGWSYRLLVGVPMIIVGYSVSIHKSKDHFNIEKYLISVWNRFPWLKVLTKAQTDNKIFIFKKVSKINLPVGINLKKSFIKYEDISFPQGIEPLEYLEKYQDNINDELVKQLGPMLNVENGQVRWKDPNVKRFVQQILEFIPKIKLKPDEPFARVKIWRKALSTHRYERTLALGLLTEARKFGVVEPANFLWLRKKAGEDLKKGDNSTFLLWRALVATGGRCAYPEGAGIFCHYQYELKLSEWAEKHPDDANVIYSLKGSPWVFNAAASFYEIRDIEKTLRKN